MTSESGQPASGEFLEVIVTSINSSEQRVSVTVRNISGEQLLVPNCVAGIQQRVGQAWEFVEDDRMCPGGMYEDLAPNASRDLELSIATADQHTVYRVVAEAARAEPRTGEPRIVADRVRLTASAEFHLD